MAPRSEYRTILTRRNFMKTIGSWTLTAPVFFNTSLLFGCANSSSHLRKRVRFNKYILKNGSVFLNENYEKLDIEIEDGTIKNISSEIEAAEALDTKIIDCSNLYISPGWVDFHCHVGGIGVDLDRIGPEMGVTAIVDAGTYGPETFHLFMKNYYHRSTIPIYVFLNVRKNGIQYSNVLYKSTPGVEDVDGTSRLIDQYPGIIKGLKVRLDSLNTAEEHPTFLSEVTAKLGNELKLPVMYHLGNPSPSIIDFLKTAKSGDIITHCLRKKNNSIIDASGKVRPECARAKSEGILFDVGHGVGSLEFDTAKSAFDQDFMEFTISSDLWLLPSWFKSRTFANVASKFLALGLSIEDVTNKISSRPRSLLDIGSEIAINRPIDLTIFSIADGEFEYDDTGGNVLAYDKRIIPEYTIVNGNLIYAGERDKGLFIS